MQLTDDQKRDLARKIYAVFVWLGTETEFGKRFINDQFKAEIEKDKGYASTNWFEIEKGKHKASDSFGHLFFYEVLSGKLRNSVSLLEVITYAKQMILDKLKGLDLEKDKLIFDDANECMVRIDQVNAVFLELDVDLQKQGVSKRETETLNTLQELAKAQKKILEQFEALLKKETEISKKLDTISQHTQYHPSGYDGPSENEVKNQFAAVNKTITDLSDKLTALLEPKHGNKSKVGSIFKRG